MSRENTYIQSPLFPIPNLIPLPSCRVIHRLHILLEYIIKLFSGIAFTIQLLPCPYRMQVISKTSLKQLMNQLILTLFNTFNYAIFSDITCNPSIKSSTFCISESKTYTNSTLSSGQPSQYSELKCNLGASSNMLLN